MSAQESANWPAPVGVSVGESRSKESEFQQVRQAIDEMVDRIATFRPQAASRGQGLQPVGLDQGRSAAAIDETGHVPQADIGALELRMRQIAALAGSPATERIGADISALHGKMERLSRSESTLAERTSAIQGQLSQLRQALREMNEPVAHRLTDLETRLDQIGKSLANRQLSVEARAAVEHSCGHILGAIVRIEGIAKQATPPPEIWNQIAAVRDAIGNMPTVNHISALERSIQGVSERLGKFADRGHQTEELARFEKSLIDMATATADAVSEVRKRPTFDNAEVYAQVKALTERVNRWCDHAAPQALTEVDAKLDDINRQVARLSKLDYSSPLSKIKEGLDDLKDTVAEQNNSNVGEYLVGLRNQLAEVCSDLADKAGQRGEEKDWVPSDEANQDGKALDLASSDQMDQNREEGELIASNQADLDTKVGEQAGASPADRNDEGLGSAGMEQPEMGSGSDSLEDEEHALARHLATRFAPASATAPDDEAPAKPQSPTTDDGARALDDLTEALQALLPMLDQSSDQAGHEKRRAEPVHDEPSEELATENSQPTSEQRLEQSQDQDRAAARGPDATPFGPQSDGRALYGYGATDVGADVADHIGDVLARSLRRQASDETHSVSMPRIWRKSAASAVEAREVKPWK